MNTPHEQIFNQVNDRLFNKIFPQIQKPVEEQILREVSDTDFVFIHDKIACVILNQSHYLVFSAISESLKNE
jgi:hypothetical protein